jgi:hypothetical protein
LPVRKRLPHFHHEGLCSGSAIGFTPTLRDAGLVDAGYVRQQEYAAMEALIPPAQWLWTAGLGIALFFPVRQLIWVMSVRRTERKSGRQTDEAQRAVLKKKATMTSVLLCFLFAVLYVQVFFSRFYGTAS